jgi:cystathionine beta-lyase
LVADGERRQKIDKILNVHEVCELNPFAVEASIAAYNESEDWLDELLSYLRDNYEYLVHFLKSHLPQLRVIPLQATYLVWIDCSLLQLSSAEIAATLLGKEKLWVNKGTLYGPGGEGFIRINIACPRDVLIEGLKRLQRALN